MSMSNIILPARTHQRIPSDDDLAGKRLGTTGSPDESSTELVTPTKWKGKGRADPDADDEAGGQQSDVAERGELEDESAVELASYPPTTEDENETRRVEENLRRWEAAERDKRRVARESKLISQETTNTPNARTSWYQWTRGAQNGTRTSNDNPHQLLRGTSHDDGATPTRGPSMEEPTTPVPHTPGLSPATPMQIRQETSPFSDAHAAGSSLGLSASAVMEPTASVPATPKNERPTSRTTLDRPVLQASQSSSMGIPLEPTTTEPFKTPPPRIVIPGEEDDESATASSSRDRGQRRQQQDLDWQDDRERKHEGKWWTEWLCGCKEDKREQQGGATNPFE